MCPVWVIPVNAAALWCLLVFIRDCNLGLAWFAVTGYIYIEWAAYRLRESMRGARELRESTLDLMVDYVRCLFRVLEGRQCAEIGVDFEHVARQLRAAVCHSDPAAVWELHRLLLDLRRRFPEPTVASLAANLASVIDGCQPWLLPWLRRRRSLVQGLRALKSAAF